MLRMDRQHDETIAGRSACAAYIAPAEEQPLDGTEQDAVQGVGGKRVDDRGREEGDGEREGGPKNEIV